MGTETALSQDTCRTRLAKSRTGVLACTERALPTVVPVDVHLAEGRIFVTVHSARLADQLVGQIVALSVGRNAFRFSRGWRVIARGLLAQPDPNDPSLLLEPYQLEGVTFVRPR